MELDARKLLGFRLSVAMDGAMSAAKTGAKIGDKPVGNDKSRFASNEIKVGAKVGGKIGDKPVAT